MKVISPSLHHLLPRQEPPRRLCSQLEDDQRSAPAWFKSFYDHVFGGYPGRTPLDGAPAGCLSPPNLTVPRRCARPGIESTSCSAAALLAAGISILAALFIGQSLLRPTIVAGQGGWPRRPQLPLAQLSHGGIQQISTR